MAITGHGFLWLWKIEEFYSLKSLIRIENNLASRWFTLMSNHIFHKKTINNKTVTKYVVLLSFTIVTSTVGFINMHILISIGSQVA